MVRRTPCNGLTTRSTGGAETAFDNETIVSVGIYNRDPTISEANSGSRLNDARSSITRFLYISSYSTDILPHIAIQ